MKKQISIIALAALFLTVGVSCKKSKLKKEVKKTEEYVKSGTWRITFFEEDGTNETSNFNGYNFTFVDGGTLKASNGTNNYQGTWSVALDDSNDDSSSDDDIDFNINFNLTNDFEDLNDDWDLESSSENEIKLKDVSGGNGGTDYLTFTKN